MLTALAATAVATTGCGSDQQGPGRTVAVESGAEVAVVAKEYSFDPATVELSGVVRPVKITLSNRGALAHNLKLFEGDRELGGTTTFQGGKPRSATLDLRPGSYRMVCTVGSHAALGMVGRLEVR